MEDQVKGSVPPPAEFKVGETATDSQGCPIGEVVHRHYNDFTGKWSYTVANDMSWHNGSFILLTPK